MGNQYDEDEDMEELEADASEDGADVEEPEEDADEEAAPRSSGGGGSAAAKTAEDNPEERTVSSRQALRDEMQRQIEEFLSRGGRIQEVDPNVTADPPRKPESEYGSRPI